MGKSSSSSSSDSNKYKYENGDNDEGSNYDGGWDYEAAHERNHREMKKLMSDTCWIYFCCCVGEGCAQPGDPCFLGQSKMCCCLSTLHTEDCWTDNDGCCYDLGKFLCCIHLGAFPPGGGPHDGIPICACCNVRMGGEDDGPLRRGDGNELTKLARETFLCWYCLCSGFGCVHPTDPIIQANSKFLCIQTSCTTGAACDDEVGCCYQYQKTCCFVTTLVCPPGGGSHDGVPEVACCGVIIKGEDTDDQSEAPSQVEMY